MKLFIRCSIETDDYTIDDFRNGGYLMVSPIGPQGPMPFIHKELSAKLVDELSDSVTLEKKGGL